MLQGINRVGKSWVGRVLVAILFGFLIVSFAIWGIGDIFRGQVRTQVATVGGQDIAAEAFRSAYQTEYQNLVRRSRQSITPEQARALGLESRVLGRLVTEATLDRRTRDLGISISDTQVAAAIQADPTFGGTGGFDPSRFAEALRSAGYAEAQFVREQRSVLARLQVAEALTGGMAAPLAVREAVHRYQTERRVLDFTTLDAATLGDVPAPSEAELAAFFDGRKAQYRAPEYRKVNVLALEPGTLAKPEAVSDADARASYDRVRDARFGTPEKRRVQQIVFPSRDEASAAADRIKAGTGYGEVARERNIDDATLNLGTVSKAELIDPAVADAAFGLPPGGVSDPIEGRFGFVLVRVDAVEAGSLRPFEEVAAELRREVALARARDEMQAVHDAIEDQRASARPLVEIAKERQLALAQFETDRSGQTRNGEPATLLPDVPALVAAVFRSDVGADNEAVRTRDGGYLWFDVTAIDGARDRTLDEIRDKVAADRRNEEISRRLTDRAREMVGRLDAGEAFEAVVTATGVKPEVSGELTRGGASGDLTRGVVTRAFATPVGKAADAAGPEGRRVVFRVRAATMPPFVTTTQEATALAEQLGGTLAEDLLAEYIGDAQKQIGVQTYPENLRRAIGGGES